jgi:Undecaprenyl-phosphate glucose phosphotransferase
MSVMAGFDIRAFLTAAASASSGGTSPPRALRRRAVPTAEAVAPVVIEPSYSPAIITGIARFVEFSLVILAGVFVHQLYLAGHVPLDSAYWLPTIGTAILTTLVFQSVGVYSIAAFRSFFIFALRIVAAWSLVFLFLLAVVFFAKVSEDISRVWLAGWFLVGLALLLVERVILGLIVTALTRSGRFDRRTAIVGGGELAESMIRALNVQSDTGIRLVGIFDDRSEDRSPDIVGGFPKLGSVDDLVEYARRTYLDLIVFTLPISAETRLLQILAKLWVLPIDIRLSAHSSKLRLRPRAYSYIGTVPLLDLFDKPIADWDLVLKWLFDKIVGSLMLIMLAPVMIIIAIAVKLDSRGPVLFRQKRYGFNNELIEVFKFRSMYADKADENAVKLVTRNDPRVTRVGRIIRKMSLDELPQLFNVVFKGNLSLVGPRPHALHAKAEDRLYDQVVDGYFARHKVKPGITGWAQVNGWRGETNTSEKIQRRVEHDLYYIENWSVFFDLYILALTPYALFTSESAY